MKAKELTWKIGGPAGYGLVSAGAILGKTFSRGGLYIFIKNSFHSNIKGLHNWSSIRVSEDKIYSQIKSVDILVALDSETIKRHKKFLHNGSALIYDGESTKFDENELKEKGVLLYNVPLVKLAKEAGGPDIMRNTVAVGASIALIDYDLNLLEEVLRKSFAKKQEIVDKNINAAKLGYDFIKNNFEDKFEKKIQKVDGQPKRIILSGNQAIAIGAIKAGCKFISAYPMTPSTGILTTLAKHEKDASLFVKQTEDELAAILTAAGAACAGVRAMTCTSGGGFALMNEGFGMVGSMEIPLVVALVQRPGPSSGLPTRTAQCDLKYAVNAAPGEVPRIVIAPGDVEDCFYKTLEAFNLAEKYQIPVIIISDKYLGMNYKNVEPFDTSNIKIDRGKLIAEKESGNLTDYKRYALTEDGVSPRVLPGKGPVHISSSYVVDEAGNIDETSENAIKMLDKLYKKIPYILKDFEPPRIYGPENADITLIGWGSTKMPIMEAMKLLEKDGLKVNYVQILYITPFQTEEVTKILKNAKKTVCIENNKTSQLAAIIKENTGLDVNYKINKYDGRPFYPEEIYEKIKEILNG